MERFNRTLADRLFSYQYHKELEDLSKSNGEWVSRLQNVVSALNLRCIEAWVFDKTSYFGP